MEHLKRVLWTKSDKTSVQFIRYVMVALIGLVFDFGGLILLTQQFHVYYVIAASISFTVALVVNYFLSMWWVFKPSKYSRWHEFLMFGAIGLVGLGLNDLLIWFLTSHWGVYYVYSKAVSTAVVFIWNFLARKAFFKTGSMSVPAIDEPI